MDQPCCCRWRCKNKTKQKPPVYTKFNSHTLEQVQLCSKSSLTAFIYVMVKVVQLCGPKTFCLATLHCQSFNVP